MRGIRKSRVPDTFQLGAIFAFFAFSASRIFSNLRVFNTLAYSDSPRLQTFDTDRVAPARFAVHRNEAQDGSETDACKEFRNGFR